MTLKLRFLAVARVTCTSGNIKKMELFLWLERLSLFDGLEQVSESIVMLLFGRFVFILVNHLIGSSN